MSKELEFKIRKKSDDTKVVTVRLRTTKVDRLDSIAQETDRTRNDIIDLCIDFALEHLTLDDETAKKEAD